MEQKEDYGEEDMMVAEEDPNEMDGNGEEDEVEGLSGIGNVDMQAEEDEANNDYKEYLKWVAEGNTAEEYKSE